MQGVRDDDDGDDNALDLLPVLCRTFPWVQSYELVSTVVQSNAKGYVVKLKGGDAPSGVEDEVDDENSNVNDDNDERHVATAATVPVAVVAMPRPRMVFCKRVIAADYISAKKDWNDLRRTLCYARTESRFYANFAPILAQRGGFACMTPRVYHASHEFSDWISEEEPADGAPAALLDPSNNKIVDKNKDALSGNDAQEKGGGLLLLEYISQEDYFQESPLTVKECHLSLHAVARLHAAAWQDVDLLTRAQRDLSLSSFHLQTRNPKELAGIQEAWEQGFFQGFAAELQAAGLYDQPSIRDLGKRLSRVALYVSQQLSPQPTDAHATMIHGDYKALNVFLPRPTNNNSTRHDSDDDAINNENDGSDNKKAVVMVDFASTGLGLGMSDVAMHIHHCIVPSDLENGGEEALVRYYWEALQKALAERQNGNDNQDGIVIDLYPWEAAWHHYKLAVVDYGRFFVGRFWKSATPANMATRKDNKNVNLINRWPKAAIAFIQRLTLYLAEIELEYEATLPPRLKH
jgi:thiamine kinase-like enzyme